MGATQFRSDPYLARNPIGLFDSGIGGGTVLREVRQLLPYEDLLYLADQAYCPYGQRSPEEVRQRTLHCVGWLIEQGAKLVVIACNSASAVALQDLRQQFPGIQFVGMVPAVKPAVQITKSGVVAVLATEATIKGQLLQRVIEEWAAGATILKHACHGWVELVEEAAIESHAGKALLEADLRPLVEAGADTFVLGCTHYPYLRRQIEAICGPTIQLIDPAPAIAQRVGRLLEQYELQNQQQQQATIRYATTGDQAIFQRLIEYLALPTGRLIAIEQV